MRKWCVRVVLIKQESCANRSHMRLSGDIDDVSRWLAPLGLPPGGPVLPYSSPIACSLSCGHWRYTDTFVSR